MSLVLRNPVAPSGLQRVDVQVEHAAVERAGPLLPQSPDDRASRDRAGSGLDLDVESLVVAHGEAARAGRGVHGHRDPVGQMLLAPTEEDRMRVVERRAIAVQREPAGSRREVGDVRDRRGGRRAIRRRAPRRARSPTSTRVPGRGFSSTGSIDGQPFSCQCTGLTKVSRPRAENARVMLRGRTPSMTQSHSPSGPTTRSPWPVFCTGRMVERAETSGFCGAVSNGPSGESLRAMLMPWPRSVPPSAIIRYQVPSDLVEVRGLGELPAGARPERARLLQGDVVLEVDLHLQDAEVRADLRPAQDQAGVGDVDVAVGIPRDVGIDAVDALGAVDADDQVAVAPGSGGIRRGEVQHPAPHRHRDHEVEDAVAVADRRRPGAARGRDVGDAERLRARADVTDELPVLEVARAVDRDARQVLEASRWRGTTRRRPGRRSGRGGSRSGAGLYRVVMRVLRGSCGQEERRVPRSAAERDRAGVAAARPGSSGDRVREREPVSGSTHANAPAAPS